MFGNPSIATRCNTGFEKPREESVPSLGPRYFRHDPSTYFLFVVFFLAGFLAFFAAFFVATLRSLL